MCVYNVEKYRIENEKKNVYKRKYQIEKNKKEKKSCLKLKGKLKEMIKKIEV